MTIRYISYFIVTIFVFSCSSSADERDASKEFSAEQQQVNDLEQKVIEIHDEVMPLMGKLVAMKEQLQDQNQNLESANADNAQDQVIINNMVIEGLETAHESMMSWMRNYEPVDLNQDSEGNLKYLTEELDKINAIKEMTDNAIAAAEETLGSVN